MSVEIPERDGDGYLLSMSDWTPEIGRAMAEADDVELDDVKWEQILKAREYYEDENVVPPIRKFAKYIGQDQKVDLQDVEDRSNEADYQIRRSAEADRLRLTCFHPKLSRPPRRCRERKSRDSSRVRGFFAP